MSDKTTLLIVWAMLIGVIGILAIQKDTLRAQLNDCGARLQEATSDPWRAYGDVERGPE